MSCWWWLGIGCWLVVFGSLVLCWGWWLGLFGLGRGWWLGCLGEIVGKCGFLCVWVFSFGVWFGFLWG